MRAVWRWLSWIDAKEGEGEKKQKKQSKNPWGRCPAGLAEGMEIPFWYIETMKRWTYCSWWTVERSVDREWEVRPGYG